MFAARFELHFVQSVCFCAQVLMCVHARVYALRIIATEKILRFINTLITKIRHEFDEKNIYVSDVPPT